MSSRAHLRDLPSAFDHSQWAPLQPFTNSPTISPQNLAQSDPRGFTSNLHIQTHSLSKPSTSFSLRDLGASESPLAPPPAHRFHTMTPIQEDARSYAGRSSPTISSVSTPRPSSPALSYVASPSAPRSSSPSPAISSFSIPPAPRRNHSGDSSHSVNVLSPNSSSDHSRSGSITTPTTPRNVGMRRKNSNDSAALLSPSSNPDLISPLSAAPSSTSSNHGIMQVVSMGPRPRTPDPLLVTLSQSELVRSMSSDSAKSGRSVRPLPSPGIPHGGLQHQKSFSQSDVSSSSQPFRTHTPTLSGSGLFRTGSPLAHPQSYFEAGHRSAPDDGFDSVLTAGEISRSTGGHRRGLVPDDRSSFYMTSDPLLTPDATRAFSPQRRNFSSDNSTPNERAVDPISLMPAAVRGAGYRIDANAPVDLA
ncbi:hypothetical protein BJ165DRAFT_1008249 [Panaeolus papilionaceus]|nr:hypothetical protein BJ165DRAFT_1008249 [Panaeolus papilionaceus]